MTGTTGPTKLTVLKCIAGWGFLTQLVGSLHNDQAQGFQTVFPLEIPFPREWVFKGMQFLHSMDYTYCCP